MKTKKNRLVTFLFSLVPGAGEMYFGMYKSGVSVMGLFFGIFALALVVQAEVLLCCLPVIWFYSFCHVHNLKNMSQDEFRREKDEILFGLRLEQLSVWERAKNANKVVAVILIVVGGLLIWTNISELLYSLPINREVAYFFRYRFPQLVLGLLIIAAGIWLIRGKKAALQNQEQDELESIFEPGYEVKNLFPGESNGVEKNGLKMEKQEEEQTVWAAESQEEKE